MHNQKTIYLLWTGDDIKVAAVEKAGKQFWKQSNKLVYIVSKDLLILCVFLCVGPPLFSNCSLVQVNHYYKYLIVINFC